MVKTKFLYRIIITAAFTAVSVFMLFIACGEYPVGPPEKRFTVSYSINGGSGSAPSSQTVKAGKDVYLPNGNYFSRSGFTFGGWNTNSSGTGSNYSGNSYFTPYGDITLYARWNPLTYTITFNVNGGNTVSPSTATTGTNGRLSSLPAPTRSGHTFNGWFTSATGGTEVTVNTVFTSNATIYARWTVITYTITYNINGGSGSTPASQSVNGGNSVTLASAVSRTGFTFGGWNTNSSGTGINYNASSSFTPSSNITLYARWQLNATMSGNTLTTGDGKSYRTVIIGGKRWMAENLNYQTSNSWCYNNSESNCNTYGRLYTWDAAMSACPSGWRLPNDSDWDNLVSAVGSNAGTKLKSQTGWNTGSGYIPGTDEFGFSALPGGYRDTDGSFCNVGYGGDWWSATEYVASYARLRNMVYDRSSVGSVWDGKSSGFSVRCSQD